METATESFPFSIVENVCFGVQSADAPFDNRTAPITKAAVDSSRTFLFESMAFPLLFVFGLTAVSLQQFKVQPRTHTKRTPELLGRIVPNRVFEAFHEDRGRHADRRVDQAGEQEHAEIAKGLRPDTIRTAQELRKSDREAKRRGLEDLNGKAYQRRDRDSQALRHQYKTQRVERIQSDCRRRFALTEGDRVETGANHFAG